ncbi:DUF3891 family protein [Neobacillus mesonae]|uniref:DUF3891 family protein n=1 Tax=Neobacillus mesonae TaxID=1193713 RepID=UPI00203D15AC|nr:DUF3891 family protein [Neobacillus mesonae]MCM3569268.1 DUF3891 family protein [Neobacillus mesonae]
MIIREREDRFIMIKQHDHAKISGTIAQNWKNSYFNGMDWKDEVILAIREHDCGWIEADSDPLWNIQQDKPYSFTDYPIESKTVIYKKGIDEVERKSKYASLLCSLHYISFLQNDGQFAAKQFVTDERNRLRRIFYELGIQGDMKMESLVMDHLKILKFCDNLSLYICLNEAGVEKENEHPFYRNGFPEAFPFANNQLIHAYWLGQETVSLSFSPLYKEIQVFLPFKEVKKEVIRSNCISKAYTDTPELKRRVKFI